MADFTLTITRTYDMQILADVIITAVEGGINYWAGVISYTNTEGAEHTRATIMALDEMQDEAPDPTSGPMEINAEVIRLGIQRLLSGEVKIGDYVKQYIIQSLDDNSAFMIDADAADAIVQAGLGLTDDINGRKSVRFG